MTTPKILDEAVTLAKLATSIGTQLNSIANKLDTVATDTSIDGDGTATDPLVLADDAVTTAKILNDAVTYDKVSQAIVDQLNLISEKLASVATDASIGGDGTTTDPLSLADDAVTTSKILNDAVTYDKVSQAIVDQLNLISEKLALVATDASLDGTGVGSDPLSLADNSVSTIKIQDRAVTNLKLAQTIVDDIDSKLDAVLTDSTLDGNGSNIPLSLADDAVSTVKVQDDAITQDKLSPDVVTLLTQSEEGGLMAVSSDSSLSGVGTSDSPLGIADDGVTTPKILDLNVTTEKLADDAVTTVKVIDQAITQAKLHPDVVAQLGDNADLLSSVATDGSIDGDGTDASPLSLADDAVTTPKILNGAVSRVKLDDLLTEDLDSKLETVATNTTIDGDGTDANPLALANGSVNRLKLNDALTAEIDGIPDNFTDLDDAPNAIGTNGQILQVNAAEDALEFVDKGLTTVETSTPVMGDGTASDPVTISNGSIRGIHVASNADISGGSLLDESVVSEKLEDDSITEDKLHSSVTNQLDGIPDNITDLDDVPDALGDADQILKVNSAGTALIFADDSEGTDGITSVASDASLDGDGTASDPLSLADDAVTSSKILNGAVSRAKLDNPLTEDLDSKLETVLTDSTIDGNGSNIPLGVSDNSVDRTKLAGSVRTELDDIPSDLTDLGQVPSALGNSGQILKMNTAGTALEFTNDETGMEGFTSVSTDSTLDGDGTGSNPLGLADDAVSTIKVIDQAITEAKLHPDVVAQLGDNENLLSSVSTDASIDGDGTDASPLSLADDAVSTDKILDNAVERDKIVDGAVSGPKVSTGAISRVKLDQALLDDLDSKLETVSTDSTITGDGDDNPLGIAANSVDRGRLSASVRTELDNIPSDVPDNITDLDDVPDSLGDAGQTLKVNSAGTALEFADDETGVGGIASVSTDATIDGDGTPSDVLGLADDAVSTVKVIDQAITQAKLHPDVVAQLGDNENLLSSVATDATIDGDGTTGDPLSLADDAVTSSKILNGAVSRAKLDNPLTEDLDSKLETVLTGSTLAGNGSNIPLEVADNSVDRSKLDSLVRDELDGIPDSITDLSDIPSALGNSGQILKMNTAGTALEFTNDETGMEGFTSVSTDSTLDGDGTGSNPLGLADDAVTTPKILDEAVTSGKLATSINTQLNSIAGKLDNVASDATLDGGGTTGDPLSLADDAVSTVKVIDQAITEAKLHPDVVAQLGDNENLLSSVATDGSIDGDGTTGSPLSLADDAVDTDNLQDNAVERDKVVDGAISGPKVSTGAISRVKLDQALLDDLDSKLETVSTDSTLDGDGTSGTPLGVSDNSVDRAKLAASVRTELDDIPSDLTDLGQVPSALGNSGQILKMNTAGTALEFTNDETGMEGFTSVSTDSTLDGDGTSGDPLGLADDSVSTPKIQNEAVTSGKLESSINTQLNSIAGKLDNVASDATIGGDGTAGDPIGLADDAVSTIKVIDQAITQAKLHPDVVAQLGDNENLLSSVATDASIDGDGTDASPLSLADDSVSPDKLQDNAVEQDKIVDGAVSGPKVSTGAISRVKLDQALLDDLDSKLETVLTDSTIDGNGTSGTPLGVADDSIIRSKLSASVRTELDSIPSDVPDNITDLDDVPNSLGEAGQIMQVNSGATALEFVNQQSGGATTFTGLTDTESVLGSSGQIIEVNEDGDGLEFVDNQDTGFDLGDLQNVTEIDDNDEIGVSKVTVPETARNSDRETILGTTEFENASVTAGATHVVEDVSGTQYIILSTVNTLPVIQVFEIGVGGTLIDRTSGIAPQTVSGVYETGDQLGPIYNIGDKYALINVTKETILVLNKTLPDRLTFDTAHPLHNFSIEDVNLSDDYSFGGVLFYKRYLYFRDSLAGAGGSTHTFTAVNVDTGVADTPPKNLDHLISDTILFGDNPNITSLQVSQDEFFIFLSVNSTNTLGIKYLADGTDVPDANNRYIDAFTHYREQVEISSTLTLALNITLDSGFLYFQFRNADGTRTSFVYDVSEETTIENKKILFDHVRAEIVENASITQLRDIPALGTTGQFLEVNAAEDGMVFRNLPPGFDVDDLQNTTEIDGDDEIPFRKVTPPENPRNSAREDVLESQAWVDNFFGSSNGFVWQVVSGVNYLFGSRPAQVPHFQVFELQGLTSLLDRTVDFAPEFVTGVYESGDRVTDFLDIGDYYLLINDTRDSLLVLNKSLPDRLTFNTSHPLHNLIISNLFVARYLGVFIYNGYLYFAEGVISNLSTFRTFNVVTGVEEDPTTNLNHLLQNPFFPASGPFVSIENFQVVDNSYFMFSWIDGSVGTAGIMFLNLEDGTDLADSDNPFVDVVNDFAEGLESNSQIVILDISVSNNFLYFDFGQSQFSRQALVYDISGQTRIENLKIPYSNFVGNVLPEGSITQLGDVTGPIGDAGSSLLVNSAGDALEFGNELQLANISPNGPLTDNINDVIGIALNYNLENYRGRKLYIRVNIDPTDDADTLDPNIQLIYRTWMSWEKRVSEIADLRADNSTTLDLAAATFDEHDLFLLNAIMRDGTAVPISLLRRFDNASGNTVLAMGLHHADLKIRNVGFWII